MIYTACRRAYVSRLRRRGRACALTCQTVNASEGVVAPEKALAPQKAEYASEGGVRLGRRWIGQPLVVLSPSARCVCPWLRARRAASALVQRFTVFPQTPRDRGARFQGFIVSPFLPWTNAPRLRARPADKRAPLTNAGSSEDLARIHNLDKGEKGGVACLTSWAQPPGALA